MVTDRHDVLGAAQRALNADAGASMSAVAEAAGISRATLHRHFDSREALLVELGTRSLDQWEQRLDTADAEGVAASGDATRIRAALETARAGLRRRLRRVRVRADRPRHPRQRRRSRPAPQVLADREVVLFAAAQAAGVLRADLPAAVARPRRLRPARRGPRGRPHRRRRPSRRRPPRPLVPARRSRPVMTSLVARSGPSHGRRPAALVGARRPGGQPARGGDGHDHPQRRPARDVRRAAPHVGPAAVGRRRVRPRAGRAARPGHRARRPVGPQADAHHRLRRVRASARSPCSWADSALAVIVDPRPARHRRRDGDALDPVADPVDLRRRPRAHAGPRASGAPRPRSVPPSARSSVAHCSSRSAGTPRSWSTCR